MFSRVQMTVEQPIRDWLTYWHGQAADPTRQRQFYRCEGCKGLVTWKMIERGGCDCGIGSRVRAAALTWHEKLRLVFLPWSF